MEQHFKLAASWLSSKRAGFFASSRTSMSMVRCPEAAAANAIVRVSAMRRLRSVTIDSGRDERFIDAAHRCNFSRRATSGELQPLTPAISLSSWGLAAGSRFEVGRLRLLGQPVAPDQVVQQRTAFFGYACIGVNPLICAVFIDQRLPLAIADRVYRLTSLFNKA